MDRDRILYRYALALSLVPDEDAAGDLFLEAVDEPDLWDRANRLRRQSGLPPVVETPPLPELTPDQIEQAIHLADRTERRRRTVSWLVFGGTGVALLLLVVLSLPILRTPLPLFLLLQPVAGLALAGMATWLVVGRRADKALWWLAAWGLLSVISFGANIWTATLFRRPTPGPQVVQQINAVQTSLSLISFCFMWSCAGYVLWRLWPRARTR